MSSEYLQRLDVQGYLRVREALHEWNPIGCDVPPDEYDAYVPQVMGLLDNNGSKEAIVTYLRGICVERMDCIFDQVRAEKIVSDLLVFWPPWREEVKQRKLD
jgi:hypothetical protein